MQISKAILLLLAVAHAEENQEGIEQGSQESVETEKQNGQVQDQSHVEPNGDQVEDQASNDVQSGSPATGDQTRLDQGNDASNSDNQSDVVTQDQNSQQSGVQDEAGAQTEDQSNSDANSRDDSGANDGQENKEDQQPVKEEATCSTECKAEEICATLTSIIDINGNTLPEQHPNYGRQEIKCIEKTDCGENFQDDNGHFWKAECPEDEPVDPSLESGGTGNKPEINDENQESNEGRDTNSDNKPLLLPLDGDVEVPIDASDEINAELDKVIRDALDAEQAAIKLTQNIIRPGELGGSCGLTISGLKCNDINLCCGTGINELGATLENICGNGQGEAELMDIGGIQYTHVCQAIKMLASIGSIVAVAYMM